MALISKRIRYLAKNTAIFAIGSTATKLISFFLVPLYTNVLSTDQYGVADFVHTICMVLAPVIVLNIGESVMRFALDKDADYDEIEDPVQQHNAKCLSIIICGVFLTKWETYETIDQIIEDILNCEQIYCHNIRDFQ